VAKAGNDNSNVPEAAIVTRGVPPVDVRVNDGVRIVHEGVGYDGGDTIRDVDGPQAQNWAVSGYVTIL
jgi:hypothetical protein